MTRRLLTILALISCQALVLSQSPWMLPNGDFRYSGVARALLQNWKIFSPAAGNGSRLSNPDYRVREPRTLFLKQTQPKWIVAFQPLQLPPGKYRLTVTLTEGSAKCIVNVSENTPVILDAKEKTVHTVKLVFEKGGDVIIHLGTAEVGEVGIVKVELDHISNPVTPVQFTSGAAISRILLPKNPTMAERFAAWETYYLCWRMTGATPEIINLPSNGPYIRIGRAATLKCANGAKADTFLYGMDGNGDLNLTGNNDRGTLYAVYRYFNSQGCAWIMPGKDGETIPKKSKLTLPSSVVTQSPRYSVRGYMLDPQIFKIDRGWEFFPYENCCDWALRNGINAIWAAGDRTFDMGEWRGGSFMQMLNHSWHNFMLNDHPEWWPLVKGKRKQKYESGLINQPCISNPKLRDFAVELICNFFKEHPNFDRYPLNPEDEPCDWCECEACCALDTIPHKNGARSPKADRSLNFVNDVARRVAQQYPDKTIELYGYGSNRDFPTREKLEKNIVFKWCFHIMKEPNVIDKDTERWLSGWKKQGGINKLAIYDYDNYLHPDTIWSGLRYSFEELIELNERFGAVEYEPESWSSLWGNPLLFQLRRDALWGAAKADFEKLVKKHCEEYYGAAAPSMVNYLMMMDAAFLKGQKELAKRPVKNTLIIYLPQLTMADLLKGDAILDEAAKLVNNDKQLEKRVAAARFCHEMTKLSLISNLTQIDETDAQAAAAAYKYANELARKYQLYVVNQGALNQLAFFYLPPMVDKTLLQLPIDWRFCTDPQNLGQKEEWFKNTHQNWKNIKVDKAWTAQGYNYHGVAWYELEFNLQQPLENDLLAFYFGAIDGTAYIYLDGSLIGDQLEPAGKMWDLPFAIKCGKLSKGAHRLQIRVEKDKFAAGIWKPVSIVELKTRTEDKTPANNQELVQ